MNIKATNSTAVSKVTTDIKIKYRMSTRGTETVKDVTAEISNDETDDNYREILAERDADWYGHQFAISLMFY